MPRGKKAKVITVKPGYEDGPMDDPRGQANKPNPVELAKAKEQGET